VKPGRAGGEAGLMIAVSGSAGFQAISSLR
jgi:hypothetical protein